MIDLIVDANVLVALLDGADTWHQAAVALYDALRDAGARMLFLDCVINEAISVLGRRVREQLNFHDALIALACRQLGVRFLASFDRDFDQVSWLERIERPTDLQTTREEA